MTGELSRQDLKHVAATCLKAGAAVLDVETVLTVLLLGAARRAAIKAPAGQSWELSAAALLEISREALAIAEEAAAFVEMVREHEREQAGRLRLLET